VVSAGQTVARLARPGEKEIAIAIPESQRELIESAKEFRVTLNAAPGRAWKGKLRELAPAADPATRTYGARISVLGADEAMDLGMSARVGVPQAQPVAGVELPIAALYARGDTPNVWVVEAGGTVRLVPVKTRGVVGEHVVIESGLNAGDRVVIAGASLIRAGQRVRVLDEGEPKLTAK
jgi:multidrug efflux system membrane fusion protein